MIRPIALIIALSTVSVCWGNTAASGLGGIALGYATNVAQNATSQVGVQQRPGGSTSTISYRNSMRAFGPSIEVFAGYQWPLNTHWHVALGEAFWHAGFQSNGTASSSILPSSYGYHYNIDAMALKTFLQLTYQWQNWAVSASINGGVSILDSTGYTNNVSNVSEQFNHHLASHFAYGAQLGISRFLNQTTRIGLSVAYEDLGKASLGARQQSFGSSSNTIMQPLRVIDISLGITHYF